MGYLFAFDAVNNIFRASWEGPITDDILLEGYTAGGRLLASRLPCRGLQDFTEVTTAEISNETILKLAQMPPIYGVDSTVVFVAPKDFHYGLLRMFSIFGEKNRPNRHVVHTIEEAYKLLKVHAPQFSRISID